MRAEALPLLFLGIGLFAGAFLLSRAFSTPRTRSLFLALSFGFTLGLGFVPAHGELIVAPVLAFLKKGGLVAVIGLIYGLVWCAAFLVAVQVYARRYSDGPR
jgi:hypothetical protein